MKAYGLPSSSASRAWTLAMATVKDDITPSQADTLINLLKKLKATKTMAKASASVANELATQTGAFSDAYT